MKALLIVSHCILNSAAKVLQDEGGLAKEYEVRDRLLMLAVEKQIQLLQLPCPEFNLYGSQRWGHVKNQFQHPYFRKASEEMLESFLLQMEEYCQHPERFRVLGIVSVEGSPSCGYRSTCTGEWKGEIGTDQTHILQMQDTLKMSSEPGVFMEVLQEQLAERRLPIPILTMEETIELLKTI